MVRPPLSRADPSRLAGNSPPLGWPGPLTVASRRRIRRPTPEDSPIEALVISILAVAAVVLIVMQVMYRRRVMRRRQAAGQDPVGRGTYVIFAVTAAFFLFAVFVFPLLVRGN